MFALRRILHIPYLLAVNNNNSGDKCIDTVSIGPVVDNIFFDILNFKFFFFLRF